VLKNGRFGIANDEALELSYKGIRDDIKSLVVEGWIKAIEYQDRN
jgi:hypothetical protein